MNNFIERLVQAYPRTRMTILFLMALVGITAGAVYSNGIVWLGLLMGCILTLCWISLTKKMPSIGGAEFS
ncbi:MAG: hypothetical protein AAB649_04150, partial [Patescibacteria group bacterium]